MKLTNRRRAKTPKTEEPKLSQSVRRTYFTTRLVAFGIGIYFGLASTASRAQPTLIPGGPISGTWAPSGNPYVITDNVYVPAGTNLTIQPGVVVEIGSGLSITVSGNIQAIGNPSNRITIQAPVNSQYWNAIAMYYSGPTNRFTYCDFSNATNALWMRIYGNNGNRVMVSEIYNCTFRNCSAAAIYGEAQSQAGACSGSGVMTISPLVKNCIFSGTRNGCVIKIFGEYCGTCACTQFNYGYGDPAVEANVFNNLSGTAMLLQIGNYAGGGTSTFVNNTVVNCTVGVNATDPWDAIVQDNIFVGSTNAMMVSGSLSRQVAYNDFYGNATNFTGNYNTNIFGPIIGPNRNGIPADLLYNIYQNPNFVATNDFHLTTGSACVNAGTPNPAYANMCIPNPSIATSFPDQGAYGGPDACNWLDTVPKLPAQMSMTKSNGFVWLNWGAVPRSTYQVQYLATNFNATSGTNKWLTNATLIPADKPVSIAISPYPATNNKAFYRVKSSGRTPGN
jgi:hypothetical protein